MLSQAADAWRCACKARLPGDYLGVVCVDDKVSHERRALWPSSDRNATWVVRSPGGDEWPEDLSCVDPNLGSSRAWLFPRVGLRPRGRRRLYAFPARLVDETLRAAIVRAREHGACRPVQVVRSDGPVRPLQEVIPDLFREVAPDGVRDGERLAARPGTRWYAAETGAGATLGDEVKLRHGDVAVDGDAALSEKERRIG